MGLSAPHPLTYFSLVGKVGKSTQGKGHFRWCPSPLTPTPRRHKGGTPPLETPVAFQGFPVVRSLGGRIQRGGPQPHSLVVAGWGSRGRDTIESVPSLAPFWVLFRRGKSTPGPGGGAPERKRCYSSNRINPSRASSAAGAISAGGCALTGEMSTSVSVSPSSRRSRS